MKKLSKALLCSVMLILLMTASASAKTVISGANSTTGSPTVTYKLNMDAERISETQARIDYVVYATPAGALNSSSDKNVTANVKITATLYAGSGSVDVVLKGASTSWNAGQTYTKSGSFVINVGAKTSTIATAMSVKGSGYYYTYSTKTVTKTGYKNVKVAYKEIEYYQKKVARWGDIRVSKHSMGNTVDNPTKASNKWGKWAVKVWVYQLKSRLVTKYRTEKQSYTYTEKVTNKNTHNTYIGTMAKINGESLSIEKYYYVKYNANGGTGAPSTQGFIGGNSVTIKAYPSTLTWTGRHYKNFGTEEAPSYLWNDKDTGDGANYSPGSTYKAREDITLYAQWDINKYIVRFDSNPTYPIDNDGTVPKNIRNLPENQHKVHEEDLIITTQKPKADNAIFKYWNTKADGTGITYRAGDTYKVEEEVRLYAIWWDTGEDDSKKKTNIRYINKDYVDTLPDSSKWNVMDSLKEQLTEALNKSGDNDAINIYDRNGDKIK